ncbi:class I SAM-dependent methyltransferase [Chitinimonas viridis]|uniref:Class I SAM-dependent methyltransferase n=1 Tax=Chitinimonas viridis TaxID=664880 RepID=A0ABT8B6W6_9NEIS|nr:class I SAM-dependent methyltransferase [Chitinimonas viridis]MDN3577878.1 class I SAM-dependent methyltransferase [Chitinimonas viridis]
MRLNTLKKLVFDKNIFGFLGLSGNINQLYKTSFATAASSCGLLDYLHARPRTLADIQLKLATDHTQQAGLEAWLGCGVRFGELRLKDGHYTLKGKLSRSLAQPRNEIAAATLEEVVRYHYDALLNAPSRLRSGHKYSLADQDGELIARSSRILEPFVEEAIEWALRDGKVQRVLEVGCGSGYYLKYLKQLSPNLQIDAIDYQQEVVASAKDNLRLWGLEGQVEVSCCDVMDYSAAGTYDLITLHNNIYYFPLASRMALLRHLHALLAPGGQLLLTTSCRGGSPAIAALNLWWSLSDVSGALPHRDELVGMLSQAGFSRVEARQMLPGESYYGFLAKADNTIQ